jgi:tetratricopeptide (TPR) repeat protein
MNEAALHEKLEKYVRGQLSQEEAEALERDISQDADLQEQVRLHRLELESHEHLLRDQLRQNVRTWLAETPSASPPPITLSFWEKWKFPMLTTALLAIVGIWFFTQTAKKNPSPEKPPEIKVEKTPPIATPETPIAHVETPVETPNPRPELRFLALAKTGYKAPQHIGERMLKSGDPTEAPGTDSVSVGILAYQAKRYREAIREFEKVTLQNNPTQYALAREWQAHTWFQVGFQTGDFKPAAKIFKSIADRKTGDVVQDRAEWYGLLCLLPDYPTQKKQVDKLLRDIAEQEFHSFREDAVKMQASLRQVR